MPTYEYRCKACGHTFEIQQSFSDEPLRECPSCKGELRKVFGNVGISFKGSGFYKNDHGSRSKASSNGSGDSSGDSSGGESKSDKAKSESAA